MVAAHVLDERRPDGTLTRTSWVVDGRASALFAVLAGVSLVLMSRRTNAVGLAVRALLVALLGLALAELETGLAIILTYYGLLFLLGLPFLGLRARALFAWAAAWVVVAPVISHLVRPHLAPRSGPSPAFDQLANPGHLLAELLLTGYYPCLPWLAYLLLGMAIGRCDLRSRSVQIRLVVGGLAVAVVAFVVSRSLTEQPWVLRRLVPDAAQYGDVSTADAFVNAISGGMHGTTPAGGSWAWLLVVAPHSGTPFDLLETGASAALVIGLCLWLVTGLGDRSSPRGRDRVRRRDDDVVALQPARGHAHRAGLARRGAVVVQVARPRAALGGRAVRRLPTARSARGRGGRDQRRRRHSMAGQVSITIGTPAATVRSNASASMTPSWNHTARAPTATAWSANSPAASERRKTSTTSMGNGTSARVAKPFSPSTTSPSSDAAAGWIGTICLPRSWSSAAMEYAVRLVSPESPTTAQTLQSSSMNRIASGSCHVMPESLGRRPWASRKREEASRADERTNRGDSATRRGTPALP